MDLRVSLSRQALNDRYKWVVKASGPGQVFGNVHPPWSGQLGRRVTYIVPILARSVRWPSTVLCAVLLCVRSSLCAFLAVWCALAVCVRPPQPATRQDTQTRGLSLSLSLLFSSPSSQRSLSFLDVAGQCWLNPHPGSNITHKASKH